ncbi:hypothetical protein ACFQ3Z_14320 [Streptomyces nogalater]
MGPALLSLAGVVLGAGGSLFGQYLVSRVSARQLEVQESAAHRAELKEAVLRFVRIALQVEKAALTRSDAGGAAADSELGRLVDDLWLAQAEIDLSARSEPREALPTVTPSASPRRPGTGWPTRRRCAGRRPGSWTPRTATCGPAGDGRRAIPAHLGETVAVGRDTTPDPVTHHGE